MTTGEKIRARRKQLGMSVDDLAAKLGKNRATIYRDACHASEALSRDIRYYARRIDGLGRYYGL